MTILEPAKVDIKMFLSKKHKGLKISHSGLLLRVAQAKRIRSDQSFMLQELDKHLVELSERFYSGDIFAVDEFLQLYCLDSLRPVKDK